MKRFLFISLVSLFFSKNISAADLDMQTSWSGLTSSLTYLYQGSYLQFTEKNNLYYAAAAAPSLWYSFEEDKRISANARAKNIPKYMQISSDLAPVLSFPIIPIAFFSYGVKKDDDRAVQFAKESFATMYLALLESAALSVIHIHERPDKEKLSQWETNFRGSSSFPSGHVIPYATFALKTFQFYGPYYAIVPSALFVATSIQRVRDGKHYLSDIVGGFFLTAFASEGVRKAADYKGNNVVYRSLFEHNFRVGYTAYEGAIGPRITMDW
ncbi:phosphatase PAP2 family protein [Bacteriovorax sp. PP10]|uniref:Phosphatase PAP2 family protein n=1 Tax=Bacteriovorax antarcticus TaxID=3088717 RepID=A0ABU5VZY8_9BACT|nr:phosphatase PAP2 family protein [Bacteriovorax sp. PP10]MEA9357869.1 phosphatase PAP2 family protein [Bacteriovorax sp. PP10]